MLCKCIIADENYEVLSKIYKIQLGSTIIIGINKNLEKIHVNTVDKLKINKAIENSNFPIF